MPSSARSSELSPVEPHRSGVVLFDLPGELFPAFAADVRRISPQPLRFRWFSSTDEAPGRVLVLVEDPPSLVVARARDQSAWAQVSEPVRSRQVRRPAATVFTERAPGVWVELGSQPANVDRLRPPAGRLVLVRADGGVETVPPGVFLGELEVLSLGPAAVALVAGRSVPAIATRLRLVRGTDHEPARLWVLRTEALAALTAYCRATHQHLLARFTVAVSAVDGVPCVVLRSGTAKGPPPMFIGPAVAYRPTLRLPNLYLPADYRLAPPLRRDALRTALGLTEDRIVWLHPLGEGSFRVETLPEAAFRPLQDWVEYRVPAAASPGSTWNQSHGWELLPFVETVEARPRPAFPSAEPVRPETAPGRSGILKRTADWLRNLRRSTRPTSSAAAESTRGDEGAAGRFLRQGERLHHARPETVNKALERCRELEEQFLKTLPTVGPDQQTARWAELAAAYDAIGNPADAALCWLNGLWGQSKLNPLWAWGWLRAEARAARPEVKAIDPLPWLATPAGPGTTRAMAAWVVWAAQQSPPPPLLVERAAEFQVRLEAHEHWLPVRAAWLARAALARLGRGDVLGLARTRDRLSDRLLATGLSLELDTPSLLRFAGESVRERYHEARRWLVDRRELIHQWLARLPEDAWVRTGPTADPAPVQRVGLTPDVVHTMAYADLVMAWGLTRFAEHTAAERLRKEAAAALPADDPVHALLRDAFEYRIAQVRDGKPPRGAWPPGLTARLETLGLQGRYAVDKLREHSRVLEPTVRIDGYRESIYRRSPALVASPATVLESIPAARFDEEVGKRLQAEAGREGQPHLAELTLAALDRAFELSEVGAGAAFDVLPAALDAARDAPRVQARLIEKGLAAAAAWDRPDVARRLAGVFLQLADGRAGWDVAETLTGTAFRALRRLGLTADADHVLDQVAGRVLEGQPPERLRSARPAQWPAALRILLHAAAGWYCAGKDEQAHAVLDEARRDLFAPTTSVPDRTALALTYAATLGYASVRVALGRLEEVFQRLTGIAVGGSTNAYYSLKPLLLVETAVRAVVSDEFALGPQVRSWLDADELAVRRRIRDELKEVMAGQGL